MKQIARTTVLAIACLLGAVAVFAADVSGKWTADMPGRGGESQSVTFTFSAEGSNLTGTMAGPRGGETPISDGKISGDEISFKQKLEMGGRSLTLLYKGKVSGDEIRFTREREGGKGRSQEFTAKRKAS